MMKLFVQLKTVVVISITVFFINSCLLSQKNLFDKATFIDKYSITKKNGFYGLEALLPRQKHI